MARFGRAFRVFVAPAQDANGHPSVDATGVDDIVYVIPVIPQGWMVYRNSEISFGGIIFLSEAAALQRVYKIRDIILKRQKTEPRRIMAFEEISNVTVVARPAPPNAKVSADKVCENCGRPTKSLGRFCILKRERPHDYEYESCSSPKAPPNIEDVSYVPKALPPADEEVPKMAISLLKKGGRR